LQFAGLAADLPRALGRRAWQRFLPAERRAGDGFTLLPELFALPEVGWLAQEGRAGGARLSGRPKVGAGPPAGRRLVDNDRHAEAFRRLVAHPRLLAPVRDRLGVAPQVLRTRLVFGGDDSPWRRDRESRQVAVAVALSSGVARLGEERVQVAAGGVLLLETGA